MSAPNKTRRAAPAPLAVLLDRSRDLLAAARMPRLEPDDRYHVCDCRRPLRPALLDRCDVLVLADHSPRPYPPRLLEAIVRFVRRGGGLLLAASAGRFERYARRGVRELPLAVLARRFGVEFLSPAAAAGRVGKTLDLVAGYGCDAVGLGRGLRAAGLRDEDVWLDRWSPVRAGGGQALLRHRRTGEPAAVMARFGRGRVMAVGETSFLGPNRRLVAAMLDRLAAGRVKRRSPRPLPDEIMPPRPQRRSGDIRMLTTPATADRAAAAMRIARKVLPRLRRWVPHKKDLTWRLELNAGLSRQCTWWPGPAAIHLGVGASDAEVAFAVGAAAADVIVGACPAGYMLSWSVLMGASLSHFLGLAAMRWCGFEAQAERLGDALEAESRRRFRRVDPAWVYVTDDFPGLWIWRELARQFGDDIAERFFLAMPKKVDLAAAPDALYTSLDVTVHFLSRATRTDLSQWFAAKGIDAHPLPLSRFGSAAFKNGVRRNLRRLLADPAAIASKRADAAEALIASTAAAKHPMRTAVRQLQARSPAVRLAAAARLSRARDARGTAALTALARRRGDDGLASVAALLAVEQGHAPAADRLATLAKKADHRFQLMAGYQLSRLGHRRGRRFSLAGIRRADGPKAARLVRRRGNGQIQVLPVIDGRTAANIFSDDLTGHLQANTHVSMIYVDWVYTHRRWRRMGLSRAAMARTFADPVFRRCSCATLHTDTPNVAHAMYRSFGFVDAMCWKSGRCSLKDAPLLPPAKGISVRRFHPGDERIVARLLDERLLATACVPPHRAEAFGPEKKALLAFRGRKAVGYLAWWRRGKRATMQPVIALKGKHRDAAVRAMVRRVHAELMRRGVMDVDIWDGDLTSELLQPCGYRFRDSGGVGMFALLSLPQFLREIRPLLELRLKGTDWSGTISILGRKHRAGLRVAAGRVKVSPAAPARADIVLRGSDRTLTRIAGAIETPFEAFLQLDLAIQPMLNDAAREMLEKLFPRAEDFEWFRR